MPKDRGVLVGRTAEIAALDPFAGSQALLLLRGSAGWPRRSELRTPSTRLRRTPSNASER